MVRFRRPMCWPQAKRNDTADSGRTANNWTTAMNQFALLYEERFTKGIA